MILAGLLQPQWVEPRVRKVQTLTPCDGHFHELFVNFFTAKLWALCVGDELLGIVLKWLLALVSCHDRQDW